MDIIQNIKDMLVIQGITTEYTDEQIQLVINQALSLCDIPLETKDEIDYERFFCSDVYITENYPIMDNTVSCMLDGDMIIPKRVTSDGLIYFKKPVEGELEVTYTVGLPDSDLQQYIIPIVVGLFKNYTGGNLAGINEGDVSVTYYMNGFTSLDIDSLVSELKNKYGHRVVFI